jgi:hypothetical protein
MVAVLTKLEMKLSTKEFCLTEDLIIHNLYTLRTRSHDTVSLLLPYHLQMSGCCSLVLN